MKKVLILAYDFPPYVSVGGLRPHAWYRYFKEFNIYPIVVTRQWNNNHGNHLDYVAPGESTKISIEITQYGTILKTPYTSNLSNRLMLKYGESKFRLIRKSVSAYYEFIQWFSVSGPKAELYFAAKEYLKKNQVDVIIATGDPFILFKYASMLGEEFNTPWIADYRDPWSQDFNIQKKFLFKKWSSFFEKKTVKKAAFITTVSPFFQKKLLKLFNKKTIIVVPNGFDPGVIDNVKEIKQIDTELNIGFAGTIHKWQPIQSFFSAISDFIKVNPNAKIKINFYGVNIPLKLQEIISNDFPFISNNVHIFPKMPNDILIQKLASNNIMLLLHYYSIIGTKIYDYIGIKRSILLCFTNDKEGNKLKRKYYNINEDGDSFNHSQEDLINETNAGYIVQDANHLRILLEQLYNEFIENGSIKCNTKGEEVYSRRNQTKLFADIIHNTFKKETSSAKKVLILAYDFPPYVSVGGLRPYAWYRYFKEFDIYPIVVTRQWGNNYENHLDYIAPSESPQTITETTQYGTIIKTPYVSNYANRLMLKHGEFKFKLVRKFVTAYYEFIQWLFVAGPKSELYFAAKNYLKTKKVDAIIATGSPFVLFKYASMLSKEFDIPWIADYRDPWSQNVKDYKTLYKQWNSYFEKKIVQNASLIITVSEFVKRKIEHLIINKQYYILPNGYDPEVIDSVKTIEQQSKSLNIAFVGTIYKWHPIRSFLMVMLNFIKENPNAKIVINLYGVNIVSEMQEMINKNFAEISNHIYLYPKMQNNILLHKLACDNVMLLFNDYSIIGTKIYDYIGVKRSILLCYGDDHEALKLKKQYYTIKEETQLSEHLQADLIRETNAGYIVENAKQLKKFLEQLYQEFQTNGSIQCNTKNAEQYSRKHQTKLLAQTIKTLNVKENVE
jgi:hypothetical protein